MHDRAVADGTRDANAMHLNMSQRITQTQQMVLAPRMIQSMEILQLPIMALEERMQQELQENPVLELKDSDEEGTAAEEGENEPAVLDEPADPGAEELVIDETGDNEVDFDRLEALSRDWEHHINEEHRPSRNGIDEEGDKKHEAMQNMASRPQSLQDYLADQLAFLDLTPEQIELCRFIISHIDQKGWMQVPLEDLARGYEQPITVQQVEEALHIVQ